MPKDFFGLRLLYELVQDVCTHCHVFHVAYKVCMMYSMISATIGHSHCVLQFVLLMHLELSQCLLV